MDRENIGAFMSGLCIGVIVIAFITMPQIGFIKSNKRIIPEIEVLIKNGKVDSTFIYKNK